MKSLLLSLPFVAFMPFTAPAVAQAGKPPPAPFTSTLSNTTPLVFGMRTADAEAALGQPLAYVSGKPGNETFMVIRNVGGSTWSFRNDKLFLLFRAGRLTGWKGDWSHNWMWQ